VGSGSSAAELDRLRKQFLKDLADMNNKIAARLSSATSQFVSSGDIPNCSMGELTDALVNCWRGDPVHGDRIAYTRITVGSVDKILSRARGRSSELHPIQEGSA
jgi:hypothetical protein